MTTAPSQTPRALPGYAASAISAPDNVPFMRKGPLVQEVKVRSGQGSSGAHEGLEIRVGGRTAHCHHTWSIHDWIWAGRRLVRSAVSIVVFRLSSVSLSVAVGSRMVGPFKMEFSVWAAKH